MLFYIYANSPKCIKNDYQQHKSLTFMIFPMANFLSNPNDDDESAFA